MKGLNALRPLSSRIVNNIIGSKRHGGKNDWDFDGVTNRKDCQPRNTMRQDNISVIYGIKTAKHMNKNVPDWRSMKNFRLTQEIDYYLKYRPQNVDFGQAKLSAIAELKKLR